MEKIKPALTQADAEFLADLLTRYERKTYQRRDEALTSEESQVLDGIAKRAAELRDTIYRIVGVR